MTSRQAGGQGRGGWDDDGLMIMAGHAGGKKNHDPRLAAAFGAALLGPVDGVSRAAVSARR